MPVSRNTANARARVNRLVEAFTADIAYQVNASNRGTRRQPILKSKDLIGEAKDCTYLTYPRKFGVELEAMYTAHEGLATFARKIHPSFGIVSDGSLSASLGFEGTCEIVSPPMAGKIAEYAIEDLCKHAKECGLAINKSCGYHLHLEAKDFVRNPREERLRRDSSKPQARIKYKFKLNGQTITNDVLPSSIKEYTVIATPLKQEILVNQGKPFYYTQFLFAFYSAFDDVFRAMQPKSRRLSRYCKAMATLYSFDEIMRTQHYDELEALWYREREVSRVGNRKNGGTKYDDSRYSGLNLHVLFSKHETVEIRYHSPTLNPEKILRWANIHQTIFEYVKTHFSDSNIKAICTENTNILDKGEAMCKLIGLGSTNTKYVQDRLKKFLEVGEDLEIR